MTARQMYDFAVGQIAWYEKQQEHVAKFLASCNRNIARSRAEDRRIAEYALATEPDDPLTREIFGGDYVSTDTRKLMNERAKYYRERKHNDKMIARYRHEAETWKRYLG